MDPELKEAACSGDVEFLRKAVVSKPTDYFLTQFMPIDRKEDVPAHAGNIFHLAAWNSKVEFIRVAMEMLSTEVQQVLLSQPNTDEWTPLHVAAWLTFKRVSLEIVQLMLGFYKSHSSGKGEPNNLDKPWLEVEKMEYRTPLHLALVSKYGANEESAMEILSMDMEILCAMEDKNRNSPLFLAVQSGCNRVAEKILMSSYSYSLCGKDGSTPLHFAPNTSENVLRLLLEKHPELMDEVDATGFNMIHQWAELEEVWPLKLILKGEFPAAKTKIFDDLINKRDKKCEDSPLHIAAMNKKNTDIARLLINGYKQEIETGESLDSDTPPWKTKNLKGNTPLHTAIYYQNEQLALHILTVDSTLCQMLSNEGASPLFFAVYRGCAQLIEVILRKHQVSFSMLRKNNGDTVLHYLDLVPEETGKRMLEKFWWMINVPNDQGRTALDKAKEANVPWLLNLLMKPSLIEKEPFDWITACEKDETMAVIAFIDHCQDLQKVCREQKDTPLHHIKSLDYKEYLKLLKNPSIAELKNTIDFEGATPLHRALEREDIQLAKALLIDDGVDRNIEDYHGRTAMSLLAKLYDQNKDWEIMCNQIKVNPHLKTTYIQPGTNLDQMRNTLSVVAALLATITFAAGFTLPGGLNDETGNAILAKQASFIVFLLADAYAMCTSMLVLFCLIWSMVSNRDMSYLLVDRSVLILMQALYGTMVAFMTGIYTMIAHNSLWAAIIIFVMCSFIGISANRTVLHNLLAKLVPTANQDHRDQARLREEEKSTRSKYSTSSAGEESSNNARVLVLEDHDPLLEEVKNASDILQKANSLLNQKTFSFARNHDQFDRLPMLNKENEFTSEKNDPRTPMGTSTKSFQNSTSFGRMKNAIPAENHEEEDQIRLLEEGRHAFTSGNDDAKAGETRSHSLKK